MIELKTVPDEEAEKLITEYVKSHSGARTGDIIYDLGLDVDLVLRILAKLKKEEVLEDKAIE
jgi:predicted ArsR family transcriptional regulator